MTTTRIACPTCRWRLPQPVTVEGLAAHEHVDVQHVTVGHPPQPVHVLGINSFRPAAINALRQAMKPIQAGGAAVNILVTPASPQAVLDLLGQLDVEQLGPFGGQHGR